MCADEPLHNKMVMDAELSNRLHHCLSPFCLCQVRQCHKHAGHQLASITRHSHQWTTPHIDLSLPTPSSPPLRPATALLPWRQRPTRVLWTWRVGDSGLLLESELGSRNLVPGVNATPLRTSRPLRQILRWTAQMWRLSLAMTLTDCQFRF